ncbi:TerB N-terminal domain-containing protein [uncultured Parolsenella sp.]|uniref:TerB N-terminal domain-containing protein n=1 Tax=uncultured Parolsenella sp. TaxID=2083008 RepID=UPI0027DAFD6A|nr:TerB N-terminal domain-containing protein [uncultured Parolsenella sp.]
MNPRAGRTDARSPQAVQQIIDRILASPRARANSAFAGRTFADEPIIRRGSQMAGYLPKRCQEMRALATSPELRNTSRECIFYHQARLMEDYTDDVPYRGRFEEYFPTYQAMSDRQLRGYFTWRTAVRAGMVEEAPLSFAFVHLYELLMGVGTTPGEQGFHDIERFWQSLRGHAPQLDRYVRLWLRDYVVYHELDPRLVPPYVDLEFDRGLIAMRDGIAAWEGRQTPPRFSTPASLIAPGGATPALPNPAPPAQDASAKRRRMRGANAGDGADNPAEERLFSSFDVLSSYRPRVSRLYRDRPETLRHVCCSVVVQLARHYDAHRKSGLMESLFGSPLAMPYDMFYSAVFWSEQPHPDTTYELDAINRYTCARGRWYWEGYHGSHTKSTKLGAVLRASDQRLRAAISYEHPLVEKTVPKYLAKIIDREIEARLAWEREQEARVIHVDLSQLAGIRAAASLTQEALLVDEEREEGPAAGEASEGVPVSPSEDVEGSGAADESEAEGTSEEAAAGHAGATVTEQATLDLDTPPHVTPGPSTRASQGTLEPPTQTPQAEVGASAPLGLTPDELSLLRSLLVGKPAHAAQGTSMDMLVDGINEKLFDLLGDTALEFDDAELRLVEDYVEDVRAALDEG